MRTALKRSPTDPKLRARRCRHGRPQADRRQVQSSLRRLRQRLQQRSGRRDQHDGTRMAATRMRVLRAETLGVTRDA